MDQVQARVEMVSRLYEHAIKHFSEGKPASPEMWERAFASYDRDSDGALTPDEFAVWLGDALVGTDITDRAARVKEIMDVAQWNDAQPIRIDALMEALAHVPGPDPKLTAEEMVHRLDLVRRAAAGEDVSVEWRESMARQYGDTYELTKASSSAKSGGNGALWLVGGIGLLLLLKGR